MDVDEEIVVKDMLLLKVEVEEVVEQVDVAEVVDVSVVKWSWLKLWYLLMYCLSLSFWR